MSMSKEETVYQFWTENNIFQQSIDINKDKPEYVFYDGPPFMTGLPHYGHILAGLIKDSVLRYHHTLGKNVPRYAAADCHGLPIEYEIEKELKIKTTQEILDYGIGNYNESCRNIVLKYSKEWEYQMGRLGRWIDFKNDYKTMDKSFMNSVWWVFSELYKKNRIYEGVKIMGYSTTCGTPLSNFEIQQNYQEVRDDSLFIKLKINECFKNYDNLNIMVWTTTPWTLPSNYCLCVGEQIDYVIVELENEKYILGEKLISCVFGKKNPVILEKIKGIELLNLTYIPPFNFNTFNTNYKIISGEFVTDSDGTGIVHLAASFGQDDYEVCIKNNIIQKDSKLFLPLDANGYVNNLIPSLEGMFYKNYNDKSKEDLNTWVVKDLKKQGFYWDKRQIIHNYPFCWRSDTPLIYRAVNSWFVKVESLRDRLCELNSEINWVPKSVGTNRFNNWLANAKDWGISRNRFWGTPIPIWKSDDGDIICVGSSYELEKLANLPKNSITDLHRHFIDDIEIIKDGKVYKRINDVLDCWFESGSLPYATLNKIGICEMLEKIQDKENNGIKKDDNGLPYILTDDGKKHKILPADFIAEGLDQTRGWFYTLLVLSSSLFDCIPFKNVIVNGLVLAEDGKKMSKRLKNYPDPMEIVNTYGSDCLRLYLLGSQAVRAEPLKFSKSGVHDVMKDIIIPLTNSINFWKEYTILYKTNNNKNPIYQIQTLDGITNPINLWILKKYSELRNEFIDSMDKYDLKNAVGVLYKLVQILNNGYIKMGRYILKGKESEEEWSQSLSTLYYILLFVINDFKSIIPFFSEYQFKDISDFMKDKFGLCDLVDGSVHLIGNIEFTELNEEQVSLSNNFDIIYNIVVNIYKLRGSYNISMKKPIKMVSIIPSQGLLDRFSNRFQEYLNIVMEECNILEINVLEENNIKINKEITPLKSQLFKKFGRGISKVYDELVKMDCDELSNILDLEDYNGFVLDQTMFDIKTNIELNNNSNDSNDYVYKDFSYGEVKDKIIILMDKKYDEEVDKLYYYRLVATSIQKSRKLAGLHPWNVISAYYEGDSKYDLEKDEAQTYIEKITRITLNKHSDSFSDKKQIYSGVWENTGLKITLVE
jgi:isoleucyl-tRNA synthetase